MIARFFASFFIHFQPANGFVQCVIRDADSDRERMHCPRCLGTTPVPSSARAPPQRRPQKRSPARLHVPGL
ncbi:hypothetical protein LGM42_22340 [Burkholderia sp. AU39826]|uniref:hypothetical protein n=1 Tax=Burkholderia sp. AU39826 TaxID=2879634 RepID=UPI001CF0FB7D|nr:hypothetical protein [Burkholderia sp. AU39826]MCA7972618.1 hypothetical protein [Burkholderia sp. AU39826]